MIHDLSEPWQAAPFQLDEAVYLQLEAECRKAGMLAPGAVLTVIDARGGGIAIVALASHDSRSDCLVVRDGGRFMVSGAGEMRGDGVNEPVGAREIGEPSVSTGQQLIGIGADLATYVVGQAGTEVGAIDLVLGNGQRVRATSWGRGWYAAWWLGEESTFRYEGVDRNGVRIVPP